MTLDLTKPMRWKSDHTPVIVLWSDDNDTFAEWQPPDDEPVRQHMRTEWFSERVENIPPEPPKPGAAAVGPEEVWVSLNSIGGIGFVTAAPRLGDEPLVRYLRADLPEDPPGSWSATDPIRSRLPRKVKPLNKCEIGAFRAAYSDASMMSRFRDAMAARGIEVGE